MANAGACVTQISRVHVAHRNGQSGRGATGAYHTLRGNSGRSGLMKTDCMAGGSITPVRVRANMLASQSPAQCEAKATVGIGPSPGASTGCKHRAQPNDGVWNDAIAE